MPDAGFVPVPIAKTVKNPLYLDLRPVDGSHEARVERLLGFAARRGYICQGEVSWVVPADPEGDKFCVQGSLTAST